MRAAFDRSEALRQSCRPEIEALHAEAQATGSLVILTDADGLILDTLGSDSFAGRAAQVALRPGVPWSESLTGTNAIGTALIERRPVEVRGAEHYFEPHRILSCAAMPILGADGTVLGVLDLTGPAAIHQAMRWASSDSRSPPSSTACSRRCRRAARCCGCTAIRACSAPRARACWSSRAAASSAPTGTGWHSSA